MNSWIESFIKLSEPIESPIILRKWAAIGTIAAVLEQKVWIQTTGTLFPNMYIWLVGKPGVGKSRAVTLAGQFLRNLDKFYIAPTSVTTASLVDFMVENVTNITLIHAPSISYNSATILADELSAFTPEYDNEIIGVLTKFYDVDTPYGQKRRGKDIRIFLERPQLNMIIGTTPSNLIKYMPPFAWDQGFTSRILLIHSNDQVMIEDIFNQKIVGLPDDMVHDLDCIRSLYGEFSIDPSFSKAFHHWRNVDGCKPAPGHPRLTHYCTRRWAHVLKLSMISSVDRGPGLSITEVDFSRAKHWLTEAEQSMGTIFFDAAGNTDSRAQDELLYFIKSNDKGKGVPEDRIIREARRLMPINTVRATIEMLERSGAIEPIALNAKNLLRTFKLHED